MGASESKTDSIDVDVDVADAPVDKTPTPTGSTLSEVDDAKPATPQAVYRTADAPAADTPEEKKTTEKAGKTPAQFPPAKPAVKPRRSLGRGLMKSASDHLGLSSSKRTPQKFGSLESVRGRTGANFEGDAELARDVPFCFCCASRQGVHVLVKGTHLFAFPPGSGKGSTPKFAVPLADLAAEVESDPHKVLIYKKYHGGAEYVLRFEDEDQVAPFCKAVRAPCLHAIDGRVARGFAGSAVTAAPPRRSRPAQNWQRSTASRTTWATRGRRGRTRRSTPTRSGRSSPRSSPSTRSRRRTRRS